MRDGGIKKLKEQSLSRVNLGEMQSQMSEKWLHQHQAALRLLFLFDAPPALGGLADK